MLKKKLKKIPMVRPTYRTALRCLNALRYVRDFTRFAMLSSRKEGRLRLSCRDLKPCLSDRTASTTFDPHYVYHPAWAARILAETKPEYHVDISSSLHFTSIVSAFVPVKFYDYRPADLGLSGLTCASADLLALPFPDQSVASLSCLHVVEHVGLGRYGDPLDPEGDLKAIAELKRVLAPGGNLLFVVPVGKPRIEYNAHRIYSYEQIVDAFQGLALREFALIPDPGLGGLIRDASPDTVPAQSYGCGCFWFSSPDVHQPVQKAFRETGLV